MISGENGGGRATTDACGAPERVTFHATIAEPNRARAKSDTLERMKKHRHHHVWKAYLRAWATKDRLKVLQDHRIRSAHVNDVAVQRDFYKLHALTRLEIAFIREFWIKGSPPESRHLHEDTLRRLSECARLRDALTEAEASANPQLVTFLDEQVHNAEEDYHSALETRAAPLIEEARTGSISFYNDDSKAILISHFWCLQHFRTAAMRQRVLARSTNADPPVDMERCWNVISHILAANVGFTLFAQRKRRPLALLDNKTSMPFITGDQPTVNLLDGETDDAPPDHLAFYYPVSPRYALLLDNVGLPTRIAERPVTDDVVRRLNERIVQKSQRQVFADTEGALAPYV